MLSALLAFLGSLIYGGSDFLGGLAATRMNSIRVTAINSASGVALLLVVSTFVGARWSLPALVFGGLAGLSGAVALGLLYACLAIGPMSILAPLMALVSAIVPIGVGTVRGERLSTIGYLGLVVGLVSIVLICFVPDARAARPSNRGILMAVGAGLAVGLYLVFIDLSPADSGLSPLIATFAVAGLATGGILLARTASAAMAGRRIPNRSGRPVGALPVDQLPVNQLWRGPVALAIFSGLTDATACILFLVALRLGDLSVVSVLNALSPAGTILLAAIVLRERIAIVQWIGLAVALAAAAMLALA
jgi:drug/metabolite transporter (DMT)-like permease